MFATAGSGDEQPRKPSVFSGVARVEKGHGWQCCSAHKLRSNRMRVRRLSVLLHVLMARLHPYRREKALALKPEAQAEGNRFLNQGTHSLASRLGLPRVPVR
jgi:hypothetical protein